MTACFVPVQTDNGVQSINVALVTRISDAHGESGSCFLWMVNGNAVLVSEPSYAVQRMFNDAIANMMMKAHPDV